MSFCESLDDFASSFDIFSISFCSAFIDFSRSWRICCISLSLGIGCAISAVIDLGPHLLHLLADQLRIGIEVQQVAG